VSTLLQDFKYGFRVLIKSPGFTAVAVIVLALGIGANSAIFSVVNAVLLRALPFPNSDRLVRIWHTPPAKSFPGVSTFAVSAANYLDWRSQNNVFEQMAIISFRSFNLTGTDRSEAVQAAAVSSDFFSTLQTQPMLGRPFTPEEDQPGHNHVVILSHGYWKSHFGANPNIIGQTMSLDGQGYTVAGVMDPKFSLPFFAEMWTPMGWTDTERAVRGEHHYLVVARLKPGIDINQAQAQMNTISSRLEQQYPADDKGWGAVVRPLREDIVSDVRPALLVLLGAVAFVLLISCANVANLVLAKTLGRRKELAIRTALGASRVRILQQILAETILISVTGGALGLILAHFGVKFIVSYLADKLPRSAEIGLDGSVLGFTLIVSVLTGMVAGLVPALRSSHANVNDALKQGLGRTDEASAGSRTRTGLVISEVALSLMLLVGAGLMVRSLWLLQGVDPGFDLHGSIKMTIPVSGPGYNSLDRLVNVFQQILPRVRAVPGVQSAGLIDDLPLSGGGSHQPVAIEGQPVVPMADQPEVNVRSISSGYFESMHIPLLQGRDLTDADTKDRQYVILVSKAMAAHFWPGENPIGKHLTMTFYPDKPREIVGVVGEVRQDGLDVATHSETLYVPVAQLSGPTDTDRHSLTLSLVVRTKAQPASLITSVTDAIHQVDRGQPVLEISTMEDVASQSLSPQRLNMLLLVSFATLALTLAAVGIYSVLSYGVRRRVREIGIRMALGAQVSDVLKMIVLEGMRPTLIGVVIGLAGALALGRVLSNLIYGVRTSDPITFVAVSMLLGMVALFASLIPALRASRVEPMKSLREE